MRERLLWVLAIAACGGGFYKVDDSIRRSVTNGHPPEDPGYITATIDLQNKRALTSGLYTDSRDHNLNHLYIYASFSEDVNGPKQIPLYLIDFDKGTIDDTRGDELISYFPIRLDARGKPLLKIQTRALAKNVADTALKVWTITKDVSQRLAPLTQGPQANTVFAAVDGAAGVLQNLAATEKAYTAQVALPSTLDSTKFADVYLILATDKSNKVLPDVETAVEDFQKQNITLCDQNGSTFVCVDNKPYDKLPYIIVTFRVQNYVSDRQLVSKLSTSCSEVDSSMIATSRTRVADVRAVSDAQRVLEEALDDRLDALVTIRKKIAAKDRIAAFNAYDSYALLGQITDTSDLFKSHYKPNFDVVNGCIQREMKTLTGIDDLRLIEDFLGLAIGTSTPEPELEKALVYVSALIKSDDDRAQSTPYARATSRIVTISNLLYQGFYINVIRQLRAAKQRASPLDTLANEIEHRYTNTNCEKCRLDGSTAVSTYRALAPSPSDVVRTTALLGAGNTSATLKIEIASGRKDQRVDPSLTRALETLSVAAGKVEKSKATNFGNALEELNVALLNADTLLSNSQRN